MTCLASIAPAVASAQTTKSNLTFLKVHCGDCHDDGENEGGFVLAGLNEDLADEAAFAKWERIFDRIETREMPPQDSDQPGDQERREFLSKLNRALISAHQSRKSTVLRRLNRREYENTLNDLFGTRLRLAELLPEDGRSHEFDNVGASLGISMVHLKKYIEAIGLTVDEAIAKTAVAPKAKEIVGSYLGSREGDQFIGKIWKKLDDGSVVRFAGGGYPSGMIRGTNVRKPGRYKVAVTGYAYQSDQPVVFSVGGTTFKRGAEMPIYGFFSFQPGVAQTVEFEAVIEQNYMIQIEPYGINDPDRYKRKQIADYKGPGLAIRSVVLEGPLLDQFPSRGHRLIFDGIKRTEIEPRNPRDKLKSWYVPKFEIQADEEVSIAKQSIERIAAFAFRRRVTEEDVKPFVELFQTELEKETSFEESLKLAVTAIFCSPSFLFLNEPNGKLDDFALASRLSFFLHRTMPDRELLRLASAGKLSEPIVLEAQTDRLMASLKFERFIEDFCDAWLDLREIDFTAPDSKLFPEFDQYLRYSMPLESKAFLNELIKSNLAVSNLVKSDFVMVNDRLAKHYEIPDVFGTQFRKVKLPDGSVRGGFLTQASVLKVSANGTNSSPVVRGVWVMERILGETPQPPPPGIPGVEPDIRGATTLRELLDKHRDSVSCKACHQRIDPPGFALEAFNPIGGFRENYRSIGEGKKVDEMVNGRRVGYRIGPEVDCSGKLFSGERFSGFKEFRNLLVKNDDKLAKAFAEKLLTFSTGRELGFSDRAEVDQIVAESKKSNHRIRDLIHLVINSQIFQNK